MEPRESSRCTRCQHPGLTGAINLQHVGCVLSFFRGTSDYRKHRANAFLVLELGSEDLILSVAKEINFLELCPEALAECKEVRQASILVKLGYKVSNINSLPVHLVGRQPDKACLTDDTAMISFFQAQSFDFNLENPSGDTPLMIAAGAGSAEVLKLLLSYGVEVDYRNSLGWTALTFAAFSGQGDCIRELVRCGADSNVVDEVDGSTALVSAFQYGHDHAARILHAVGARTTMPPNVRSEDCTPWPSAAQVVLAFQTVTDTPSKAGPLGDWLAFVVFETVAPLA